MNKIDKRNRIILRRVVILNAIMLIISILLWYEFHDPIGGLFVIVVASLSWTYMKVTEADRYLGKAIDILRKV